MEITLLLIFNSPFLIPSFCGQLRNIYRLNTSGTISTRNTFSTRSSLKETRQATTNNLDLSDVSISVGAGNTEHVLLKAWWLHSVSTC